MKLFPLHAVDFYKISHRDMYPKGTEFVYSNFTPRSDKMAGVLPDFDHKVVNFGLQAVCQWMLIDLWNKEFFRQPKNKVVSKFQRRMTRALGPVDISHIERLHDIGHLPVEIKALPEGARVNMRVPLFTITNTNKDFFWLTNYLETQLSAQVWKSVTTATTAFEYRRLLEKYAGLTGSDASFVDWQGHDFSYRGMSGIYDGAQCGAAHLLSFSGTDTIAAIDYLEDYYGADDNFIAGSVPATEHSVMCIDGQDGEIATFNRLLSLYPTGVLSVVSDTWDFWKVLTDFAVQLKDQILSRDGKLVFRPDSGDPVKIICGDPQAPMGTPESKGAVQVLHEIFGGTLTSQGYTLLNGKVGLIYGDSITLSRAQQILEGLKQKGFASGNIVFGVGSFTYQYVTRDSYGTAIKATFAVVNGKPRELFKAPKTDNGTKNSARGLLRVERKRDGNYVLHDCQTTMEETEGELKTIFKNGKLVNPQTIYQIKERLFEKD